jgi:DNA polymerase-3 subunit delta
MVYLFLNCDEYLAAQRIALLKAALGDAEMASLNTIELEAARTTVSELLGHASMMPFLAAKRLVLVRGFLERLDQRLAASKNADSAAHQEAGQLLSALLTLPDSCDLLFIENSLDKRRALWKGLTLPATEKLATRKIAGLDELLKARQISLEELATPDAKVLPGWIQGRAKAKQIAIDGRAVQMLADFVGPHLRQLENELEKLALYASGRAITPADVKLLVSDVSEALIWDLTDALSQRNGRGAMQALYDLRRGDINPFQLLTMIARQVRIMIKVKEAMRRGGDEFAIAEQVGEKPYPVKKAMSQASKYSASELDQVMERLLEADYAMKTGADVETQIDLLVAELTKK